MKLDVIDVLLVVLTVVWVIGSYVDGSKRRECMVQCTRERSAQACEEICK